MVGAVASSLFGDSLTGSQLVASDAAGRSGGPRAEQSGAVGYCRNVRCFRSGHLGHPLAGRVSAEKKLPLALFASLVIGIAATAAAPDDQIASTRFSSTARHVTAPGRPHEVWVSDEATLAGRRLFGTSNPVRMLQAVAPCGPQQGPRVVMANGDVLAGKVVGFLPASPGNGTPARLLIALEGSLLAGDPRGLVVLADRVLRVTSAEAAAAAGKPGSLVLADRSSSASAPWSGRNRASRR